MNTKLQLSRKVIQFIFLGMVVLGLYFGFRKNFKYVMFLSFLAGNYFCGWICPYGTVQEIFGNIGDRIFKKKYKMPYGIQKYLQFSRYIIYFLLTFEAIKVVLTEYDSYKVFMRSSGEFPNVSLSLALLIMLSFPIISMFFERPFCNYFCPEAFKFSIRSITRIFTIKRDEEKCVNCKKCDKVCPMNIEVSTTKKMRSLQCINCFKCIGECPVKNTLEYGCIIGKKKTKNNEVLPLNN